eukprot:c17904_g2_i1 orf=1-978(-)
MALPSSGLCLERSAPACWSPQEPTLIHGQIHHTAGGSPQHSIHNHQLGHNCRACASTKRLFSTQTLRTHRKSCHICSKHQGTSYLNHRLKDSGWEAVERIQFKKKARIHSAVVQIMTQEALCDAGTFKRNRAKIVEARFPSCTVPLAAPSSLQMLETFSYDELLSQVDSSTSCGDQHGILYHLLRRCISKRDLTRGREVHHYVKRCGFASDDLLGTQLIQMYASLNHLVEAYDVFIGLPEPDLFTWTAIISAHATLGESHKAIKLYFQLQSSNAGLDGPVFMAALKACAAAAALEEGKLIHADIIGSGWETDTFVGNTVVDMYAKC